MDHRLHPKGRQRGRAVLPAALNQTPIARTAERIAYARRLCADPATPLWRIDEAFVEVIRPELVTRSGQFYQQQGRGIIMNLASTDLRHMAPDDVIPCYYVSDVERQQHGHTWPDQLCCLVRDYDPEHEMIVVIHHDTSPPVFRRMQADVLTDGGETYVWQSYGTRLS